MLCALGQVGLQKLDHGFLVGTCIVSFLSYAFVCLCERGHHRLALGGLTVVAQGVYKDHDVFLLQSSYVGLKLIAENGGDGPLPVFWECLQ